MSQSISSSKVMIALAVLACLVLAQQLEAKLLHRSRYYDDIDSGYGGYGGYGGSPYGSGGAMATGERALLTVRGTRNPYDGSAPSKLTIEDNPYRGQFPRGVYDRLDGGRPAYPRYDPYSGGMGGYGMGPYGGGGYGRQSMFGAPSRIAVTGAYPYGYGARY